VHDMFCLPELPVPQRFVLHIFPCEIPEQRSVGVTAVRIPASVDQPLPVVAPRD